VVMGWWDLLRPSDDKLVSENFIRSLSPKRITMLYSRISVTQFHMPGNGTWSSAGVGKYISQRMINLSQGVPFIKVITAII
jgi:hypothetical protein